VSKLSAWLKRQSGGKIPEVDILKHPVLGPFISPLLGGLTRDAFGQSVKSLPDDALIALGEQVGAELERRGL
jgi:hypothetical protein